MLIWHNDKPEAIKAKKDKYASLLKTILKQIDIKKNYAISKSDWVSFLTKGNENWKAMTQEEATQLFLDVTNGSSKVTNALLDGYLKAQATLRCMKIFKEDFKAETTFVIRNFKIKAEQFIDGMVEIGVNKNRAD